MPAGRPSKYTKALLQKAGEYLLHYAKDGVQVIPTIAGLALHIGVRRETVHVWCNDPEKEEFSNIVSDLLAKQEILLSCGSLTGDLNPTISKLLLTKHGYSERVEQDVTSGGEKIAMPTEIVLKGVKADG